MNGAHNQDRATALRIYDTLAAVALVVVLLSSVQAVWSALHSPLSFDDSYMFVRYADHLRAGLGFSWNNDGAHTYGPTSLLWSAVVFAGSFLPGGMWTRLVFLSFVFAIAGAVSMAWAVARNLAPGPFAGETVTLRTWRVLPWVVLPLAATPVIRGNQATGMETMLALALCAVFTGAAIAWRRGTTPSWALPVLGVLLYLSRPEAALVAIALPVLLWIALPAPRPSLRALLAVEGGTLLGVVFQLGVCRLYFGTPVPLSVYMKGHHAYLGYLDLWHPELLLAALLLAAWPFLAVVLLFGRGAGLRLWLCCAAPAAAIFLYLQTVTQIMGFYSRYYVPYLPLLIVPALLVLADSLRVPSHRVRGFVPRAAVAALLLLALTTLSSEGVAARVRQLEHRVQQQYDAPVLTVAATRPLPDLSWQTATQQVTDRLVRSLPVGASVGATEVGYLGAAAPRVDVIDLAGLNDTRIALHGFSMDDLLARHPDVIWLPNVEYTWQRGVMFADPRLLEQYDVYANAAIYGIALRKDSPHRAVMDAAFHDFWQTVYPGYNADDYRVQAARWSGRNHTVSGQ